MSFLKNLFGKKEKDDSGIVSPSKEAPTPSPAPTQINKFELHANDILLNQSAANKSEAIALIAKRVLENGYTDIDFTEAMLTRESHVSTYLMNGIAIPHGTLTAKKHILKTGIVVAQFPQGIVWNDDGDIVHFMVGIVAKGDDHLAVLSQLTDVVQDEALAKKLGSDATADEIAQALGQSLIISPTSSKEAEIKDFSNLDLGIVKSTIITDEAGIHARPAAMIAKKAASFSDTKIQLRIGNKIADAKAIMKLLSLGGAHGQTIFISAEGANAQEAVDEMLNGFINGWDPK